MHFPDRGCVHTLLTLYVYATGTSASWGWNNLFHRPCHWRARVLTRGRCSTVLRRRGVAAAAATAVGVGWHGLPVHAAQRLRVAVATEAADTDPSEIERRSRRPERCHLTTDTAGSAEWRHARAACLHWGPAYYGRVRPSVSYQRRPSRICDTSAGQVDTTWGRTTNTLSITDLKPLICAAYYTTCCGRLFQRIGRGTLKFGIYITVLCLYLGQCSVLLVSLSCPAACPIAFKLSLCWTNKDR